MSGFVSRGILYVAVVGCPREEFKRSLRLQSREDQELIEFHAYLCSSLVVVNISNLALAVLQPGCRCDDFFLGYSLLQKWPNIITVGEERKVS